MNKILPNIRELQIAYFSSSKETIEQGKGIFTLSLPVRAGKQTQGADTAWPLWEGDLRCGGGVRGSLRRLLQE